jgi:hypothetical protein
MIMCRLMGPVLATFVAVLGYSAHAYTRTCTVYSIHTGRHALHPEPCCIPLSSTLCFRSLFHPVQRPRGLGDTAVYMSNRIEGDLVLIPIM